VEHYRILWIVVKLEGSEKVVIKVLTSYFYISISVEL